MAQQSFGHFSGGGGGGGGNVDPSDIMSPSYQNFNGGFSNSGFGDDELLEGLSPADQAGVPGHGPDFNGMGDGGAGSNMHHGVYSPHQGNAMPMGQADGIYSNTPDGDPIQSPFLHGGHSYNGNPLRQVQHSMQSPISGYSVSPLAGNEMGDSRMQMSQSMQRKSSNTRSPMTPKPGSMPPGFGPQPIQTSGLASKSPSGHWMPTPGGSMASYASGFSSPMQLGHMQLNEVLKQGTSLPPKLGAPGAVSSQEMKRKRRRESHNLVERRRRDNINERIQDLSKLVPSHRLEDEKIRKMIQNGTPLSPTLGGSTTPNQATSGLAGPGARRAAGAGNITTGLPIEDKDKGPNKGDILNGAVSWTRDLMWMLHLKLQQQEELMNTIAELGGQFPFEPTEDEKRMQSELMDAMAKSDPGPSITYSRTSGSGLRVPRHTDYKGEPLNGAAGLDSGSPPDVNALGDLGENQFWHDPDDDGSGHNSVGFKEEDEFDIDMTQ